MDKLPIIPVGHRILILVDEIDSDIKGMQKDGNIITTHSTDDFETEREFQELGTVAALGPSAYNLVHHDGNWVEVGDHILYKKYDGKKYLDNNTGNLYRIINDEDVIAKIPN